MNANTSPSALQNLKIAGLVPLSTQDWPEHLAAVVFLQGCRWRCGYCHNPHLWTLDTQGTLPWEALESFLSKRKDLLDGVVLSGGEPTLHPELSLLAEAIKSHDFMVGLHTGGYDSFVLEKTLPFLDWVALDFKNLPAGYKAVTTDPEGHKRFEQALKILLDSEKPLEIRTTVHPQYHNEECIVAMAEYLHKKGVKSYYLQEFREQGVRMTEVMKNYVSLRDILSQTAQAHLASLFPQFGIRWGN